MAPMENEVYTELTTAKKKQNVLNGDVKLVRNNQTTGEDELIIDYKGCRVVIPRSEVDDKVVFKSLVSFVGNKIDFVVKSVSKKDNICVASRAAAQKITTPEIVEKLEDGECFEGRVINILPYGAYVEINGVTGLMKNSDFAEDYTSVKEVCHVGDKLMVKLRGKSKNGNLLFEAVNKYLSPTAIRKEDLKIGDSVMGVVRSKQPWGIFVNVAPGLDALVDSEFVEVEEDQKVTVRIKNIKTEGDKLRVRGKIIAVL